LPKGLRIIVLQLPCQSKIIKRLERRGRNNQFYTQFVTTSKTSKSSFSQRSICCFRLIVYISGEFLSGFNFDYQLLSLSTQVYKWAPAKWEPAVWARAECNFILFNYQLLQSSFPCRRINPKF